MLRDGRWRALLVIPLLAVAVALFVWHGPDWHLVHDAFTVVLWRWVIARDRAQPAVGAGARALVGHDDQAVARSAVPALPARLLGVLGRTVRERGAARAGSASSRASRCCAGACRGGRARPRR